MGKRTKHRGGINFYGIYVTPKCKAIFENQYDTSYARPLILKIEDVIESLINEHKKIASFADFLYEFMEFDTLENLPNTADILNTKIQPKKFSAQEL